MQAPAEEVDYIDWNSEEAIRIEKHITFTYGRKFRDRGPPPPEEGGPDTWRNQAWRASGQRWGNRGGKHRAERAAFFANKRRRGEMPSASSASSGGH